MARGAADMAHLVGLDILRQFARDVAGAVVAEQPGLVQHRGAVAAGGCQGEVQRVGHVLGAHVGAQLPGDDVAREVVEHGRQVHPAPPDDLEVGKVGLPHLVRSGGFGVELVGRLDHNIGRAGDQVMGLEQPVNRGLGHEVALLVGEAHGQLPGAQLRLFQRQLDDLVVDVGRDAVPHPARGRGAIFQRLRPALEVVVVPAVECPTRDAELVQRALGRQVRLLDGPDDLELLGCGIPHSSSPPSAIMLFLSRRFSSVRSATHSFRARASRRRSCTSPVVAARAVSPARRRLPASMNSFDQV